ncbi:hypothetical protein ES705_42603 [subsurface metagenome]
MAICIIPKKIIYGEEEVSLSFHRTFVINIVEIFTLVRSFLLINEAGNAEYVHILGEDKPVHHFNILLFVVLLDSFHVFTKSIVTDVIDADALFCWNEPELQERDDCNRAETPVQHLEYFMVITFRA